VLKLLTLYNSRVMNGDAPMAKWRLDDARRRFTEVVEKALTEGPQTIAVARGRTVVLSSANGKKRSPRGKPARAPTVLEALLAAPHDPEFRIPRQGEYPKPAKMD
jgi:prevent-host-death family protein